MRAIDTLTRYRRDVKLMKRRGYDMQKLVEIVNALASDAALPPSARPHKLVSQSEEVWDVHIGPDWILLYEIDDEVLTLRRTGTHSDLF